MKYKIKITGLDCANCALELEEILQEIEGVKSARVSFTNMIVYVECDEKTKQNVIDACNNFEEVKVITDDETVENPKLDLILLIVSIFLFIIAFVIQKFIKNEIISNIIYIISYLICGYSVIKSTIKNIIKGKIFDECFLMTISSIGAMLINEVMEGSIVMILYQLGEYLQKKAVNSSRKEITSLVNLKVNEANLLIDNEIKIVESESLKINDIILIKKGESVPVDSIIIEGNSEFDTKSLTGESLLRSYTINDEILSSYINKGDVIKAKVIRPYSSSAVSKILSLIEDSSEVKAQSEKFITKFAKIYTPLVCCLAFIVALIVPTLIGIISGNWNEYSNYIYRALTLLVISCPCALVISVPLTYFSSLGVCAKNGILVKGANYLDLLSNVSTICFDKTGTLTEGNFKIINYVGEEALQIASALEKNSTHPLSLAFKDVETNIIMNEIEEISGQGLKGKYQNNLYLVGNKTLLENNNVKFEKIDSLSTIIYVSKNSNLIGYIEIDDVIKQDAKESIVELKKIGIKELVILSGDNQTRVNKIKDELNLTYCYGELQPQDKLEKLNTYKEKGIVVYVGDGINDAPVMVNSNCSFSMGTIGSDVAIEASDIVLIDDKLSKITTTIRISKKTKRIVYQNIIFSIICKLVFMILGVLNLIPLTIAIFADVGVMLIAIINSLRVRLGVK